MNPGRMLPLVALLAVVAGCGGGRGRYFPVRDYVPRDLPTRYGARDVLPQPILGEDDDVDALARTGLHDKVWTLYFRHLRWPRVGTGFVADYIDEAFNPHLFQWDTAFMMFFGRYAHRAFPAIVSLDNFYARQHADGYICREIDERTGDDFAYKGVENTVNPPLFAWAEWDYYRVTGDAARLARVLVPLVKYHEWIDRNRRRDDGTYWNTPLGSGMDNTPRTGDGWICMTAQQALAARCIRDIARVVGDAETERRFQAAYAAIGRVINDVMWDERDRFYYDVKAGAPSRVKTPASYWPLVAGVTPADRANAMAAHVRDPEVFWRPHLVPSLAADHPDYDPTGDYWRGAVWAPLQYQLVCGLATNGHEALAAEIARNHLDNLVAVHEETDTVWENYAPESAAPGEPARGDFVGWSGLGATAMFYEFVLGLRADGVTDTLTWRMREARRHGVRQFCFGRVKVSVLAHARASADAPPVIDIECDAPFTLVVQHPAGETRRTFEAGTTTWRVAF